MFSDSKQMKSKGLTKKIRTYSHKMNSDVILSVFDGAMQSSTTYNCNIIIIFSLGLFVPTSYVE